MTDSKANKAESDDIVRELHRVRTATVDSFGGDLYALTEDARKRQEQSGRPIWRGKIKDKRPI